MIEYHVMIDLAGKQVRGGVLGCGSGDELLDGQCCVG
jgi:hypothetical protein